MSVYYIRCVSVHQKSQTRSTASMVNTTVVDRRSISHQPAQDHPLPLVESLNNEASVNQAHELVKRRVNHYESIINAHRELPGDQKFFTEERITLRDGGEIRSASTPEGRFYYLVNNNQWLYLERSTDERFQTLLVCESSPDGPKMTQKFTAH